MKGTPGGGGGGKNGGNPGIGGEVVRWSLAPKSSGGDSTGMCKGEMDNSPFCSRLDSSPGM